MSERWAIVGGGMLGSACALRLAQAGMEVSLYETQPSLGGLTSQLTHNDVRWDRFYHVIERSDTYLLNLLAELELTELMNWQTTRTNFYDGIQLHPLNNAIDYFRLPALGLIDKLRIGLTIVYGSKISDGSRLEKIPLSDWLISWSGRSAYNNLWLPLLRGKLGDNHKIASAAFIWAVIQRFYGAREGVQKTESFGYVRGGYARILDRLSEALNQASASIHTNCPIEKITSESRLTIHTQQNSFEFDKVLITTPSSFVGQICPQLSAEEKTSHGELSYQGVVCVSLLLSKPLAGAYLTYITDQNLPFTTVIEMTTLVETGEFGDNHLVYLPKYVPANDELFNHDDDAIVEQFVNGLRQMFPKISTEHIVAAKVSRARQVTAIPTLDYSAKMPAVETSVPNLYISNSAQITNAALSVNESVKLAENTVRDLLSGD